MSIEENLEENYEVVNGIMELLHEYCDEVDEELELRIKSSILTVIRYSLEEYSGERITGYDLFDYDYKIERWLKYVREDLEEE